MLKLVKDNYSLFWYWLSQQPVQPEILWKPSFNTGTELAYSSPLAEPTIFVACLPKLSSTLTQIELAPGNELYLLLPGMGKKSKVGKLVLEEFKPPKAELEVDPTLASKITSPLNLAFHAELGWGSSFIPPTQQDVVQGLLAILKENYAPLVWRTLEPKHMYSLLLTPEQSNSGLYKLLAGKGETNGLCASLWFYWNYYFDHTSYMHNEPSQRLSLFATWVVLASTVYYTPKFRGFYGYIAKNNREYFSFEPSPSAIAALDEVIFSTTLLS